VTVRKNASTPSFDEKEITPVVKAPAFLGSGVDATHAPKLKGLTATVLKDTALEVMSTDDGDPLLAFWPIGLGRTAVFASDVKDRWAANWIRWKGYGPFFASVIHAIERKRAPQIDLQAAAGPIDRGRRTIEVAIEARDANGGYRDLLRPSVAVASDGRSATVMLRQVAPGRYEASVLADASHPVRVSTADPAGGTISKMIVPDPAAEYRFRLTDNVLLKSIASATAGTWNPELSALQAAPTDKHSERRPLWPALTIAALILWFIDLLLRRIRVLEPKVAVERSPTPVARDLPPKGGPILPPKGGRYGDHLVASGFSRK